MRVFDTAGEREEIREHRFEYLVFHDVPIPYSGKLSLSYPDVDLWEQPYEAEDEDEERIEILLTFDDGVLMETGEV